jgi:homoserine O-acetyltransferase
MYTTFEGNFSIDLLPLENGQFLRQVNIRYHILGDIGRNADRVVWICHAFTANSNPAEWWPGIVGEGKLFDPQRTTVVCANILGSCYGSTGPKSVNPETNQPYLRNFPLVTFRDVVRAHNLLRQHLGIAKIWMLIGGSVGGYQAMEWECMFPGTTQHLVLIATAAASSPWVKAFSQSQRLALLADQSFVNLEVDGGRAGLVAARSIALLSYRGRSSYNLTQQDIYDALLEGYSACSYQTYQGEKLANRFDAYSYYSLTLMLDSHNMGRSRAGVCEALASIQADTLVVGIDSDILFPVEEQIFLARYIPNAHYIEIHSDFCHDGFLIENEQLSNAINSYLGSFSRAY